MSSPYDTASDPVVEWLYHVQPVGLVIGPNVLRDSEYMPEPARLGAVETEQVRQLLSDDPDGPALTDPWTFFAQVLHWPVDYVAGAPGGPDLPGDLGVVVEEHGVTLTPDWAVRELGEPDGYQILVKLHLHLDADQRGVLEDWEATPHLQFERLLRERGIPVGLLVDRSHLRLIYAPRGETSGWISFPLRSLATVAGRSMLAGLKLILGHARLFTEPQPRRLPNLLKRSREAQNEVSTKLSEQVLGALHELLRAFHGADPARIEALATSDPHHLYEGLLTTLMRLVFLLYAEDRDLMPTTRTGEAVELYEQGYSVRGLYARLSEDRALNPDTMDERVGAWGQLLALFRLIHSGHPSGWITARGGKLFDPNVFAFLEGRADGSKEAEAQVLSVKDGAILRILEGLMTLEAKSVSGERVRERLSYRSLDVEQIGSVYETIMGFTVEKTSGASLAIKAGKNNRTPVFVDLDQLLATKGKDRIKYLKEEADRGQLSANVSKAVEAAASHDDLAAAFSGLVDLRASPDSRVSPAGTPVLQPTDERRRSGSHYTPRSLTEPIVRHALEPTFERLRAEATPDQVLDIKVCDPACGSGAFLVEACRQLGERLEAAWGFHKELKPTIPSDEDEALHARRLVAQRCIYGVDKNPLAVDLARLSLWLATLAREHEFTFLDHAIKAGDSLVGLTRQQIEAANWDTSKPSHYLLRELMQQKVGEVMTGRRDIQFAGDDVKRALQEARHRSIEDKLIQPRVYGDAVLAAFFSADKPKARETKRVEVESLIVGSRGLQDWDSLVAIAATLQSGSHPIKPLHWYLEFPEVFVRDNGGFDAIIGNPPFLGGKKISTSLGDSFSFWLEQVHPGATRNADLAAHFFRRAYELLRNFGGFGLISTKTICQGDTRVAGLAAILVMGGSISRATKRLRWPGDADVVVSVIHVHKGSTLHACLDGRGVNRISAYLVPGDLDQSPQRLSANSRKAFVGCYVLGVGFTFDDKAAAKGKSESITRMNELIAQDSRNAEVIYPFVGGEEINNSPNHAPHRFVINFFDRPLRREADLPPWSSLDAISQNECLRSGTVPSDFEGEVAADWPDLLSIVQSRVRPIRIGLKEEGLSRKWWQFARKQPGLTHAISDVDFVLATGAAAVMHHMFARMPSNIIFSHKTIVFPFPGYGAFAIMQSSLHELWSRHFGSTFGSVDALTYNPTQVFQTFPFPENYESDLRLDEAGKVYHNARAEIMLRRKDGMTQIYNAFHNCADRLEDIQLIRDEQVNMDRAVLQAYGWEDLAKEVHSEFLTFDKEEDLTYQDRYFWKSSFRDEALARLLKLNAERHNTEVALGFALPGDDLDGDEGDNALVDEEA